MIETSKFALMKRKAAKAICIARSKPPRRQRLPFQRDGMHKKPTKRPILCELCLDSQVPVQFAALN